MKLEPRPYRIGDCLLFNLQQAQALDMAPEDFAELAARPPAGPSWTFWRGGEPIACGGLILRGRRCEAWALVGARAGALDRGALLRFARAALDNAPATRIEAFARDGWAAAGRALERLGFDFEGVLRRAAWDGADLHLYARVK